MMCSILPSVDPLSITITSCGIFPQNSWILSRHWLKIDSPFQLTIMKETNDIIYVTPDRELRPSQIFLARLDLVSTSLFESSLEVEKTQHGPSTIVEYVMIFSFRKVPEG